MLGVGVLGSEGSVVDVDVDGVLSSRDVVLDVAGGSEPLDAPTFEA